MIRKARYNEVTDIKAVDQIGWIDVGEAIKNGFVPGSLEADDMVYNEIDDPASMILSSRSPFAMPYLAVLSATLPILAISSACFSAVKPPFTCTFKSLSAICFKSVLLLCKVSRTACISPV